MNVTLMSVIVDAADLDAESSFWHRLLGGSITPTPTDHFLQVAGMPVLVIHHAPGQLPPRWPDGADQQLHIDLGTDDPDAADRRVLDAGGSRLRPTHLASSSGHGAARVYASPAGHPFCIRPTG